MVVSAVVDSADGSCHNRGELGFSQNALDNSARDYTDFGVVVLLFMAVAPSVPAQ